MFLKRVPKLLYSTVGGLLNSANSILKRVLEELQINVFIEASRNLWILIFNVIMLPKICRKKVLMQFLRSFTKTFISWQSPFNHPQKGTGGTYHVPGMPGMEVEPTCSHLHSVPGCKNNMCTRRKITLIFLNFLHISILTSVQYAGSMVMPVKRTEFWIFLD